MPDPITPDDLDKLRTKCIQTESRVLSVLEASGVNMLRANDLRNALAAMIDARIELALAQRKTGKE